MNREEIDGLPAALDVATACRLLDIGLTVGRDLVRRGEWPTPVLKLGAQYRIPTRPLLRLLGLDPDSSEAAAPTAALAIDPASPRRQELQHVTGPRSAGPRRTA